MNQFFYITILFPLTCMTLKSSFLNKDINKVDDKGQTAIHRATCNKDVEQVNQLLNDGNCIITKQDKSEKCFLHYAVEIDALEIVKLAVEKPNFPLCILDDEYKPAIFYTVDKAYSEYKERPNHASIFELLLFNAKTDATEVCFDTYDAEEGNLLYYIFKNGHKDVFTRLAKKMTKDENLYQSFQKALEIEDYDEKSLQYYYEQSSIKELFSDLSLDGLNKTLRELEENESHNVPNHTHEKPKLSNSPLNSINKEATEEQKEDPDEHLISSKEQPLLLGDGNGYGMQPMRSDSSASSYGTFSMIDSPMTGISSLHSSINNFPKDQTPQQQGCPVASPKEEKQTTSSSAAIITAAVTGIMPKKK